MPPQDSRQIPWHFHELAGRSGLLRLLFGRAARRAVDSVRRETGRRRGAKQVRGTHAGRDSARIAAEYVLAHAADTPELSAKPVDEFRR